MDGIKGAFQKERVLPNKISFVSVEFAPFLAILINKEAGADGIKYIIKVRKREENVTKENADK